MGYENGDWGVGQWLAMGAMMLLFWGLVIGLVVWGVRSYRNTAQAGHEHDAPSTLLAERYARGEIDEDEYLRRRELLHSAATGHVVDPQKHVIR